MPPPEQARYSHERYQETYHVTVYFCCELAQCTAMHEGNISRQGQRGGAEIHALSINELPPHNHRVSTTGNQGTDTGISAVIPMPNNVLASQARGGKPIYSDADALLAMHNDTISRTGGGQAHNNMQPVLTINFAIAIQGLFPSRN